MAKKKLDKKLDLNSLSIPDEKKRRGSFIVRIATRRMTLRQNRAALKAASRMVLVLPLIQVALLVGVLKGETWMLLLGLEGLMIAWLATGQLSRPNPESKLLGYGLAVLNTGLLGAVGLFLGSHVFWVVGLLGLLPVTALVFRATGARTIRHAWLAYVAPLLLLALFCGAGRATLIHSETLEDPHSRRVHLDIAWYALQLRGANGTERALMRLRQAQAAFAEQDYESAYRYADDGAFDGGRFIRPIPVSLIGQDLLDSLLRVKAQSHYNRRWGKHGTIFTPIAPDPLPAEILADPKAAVRWGW
ncbi:MAG: hypothetical protein K8I27_00875 [Planctomycetes bacterium]|nr:hypothetical protein [Planctomycetota bacterium]